jgi:hypothetical protein
MRLRFTAVRIVRRRLTAVPFATAIALVGVNGAVNLFTQPQRTPAHNLLSPWDDVWAVLYGIGGLLILAGIATAKANIEAAGCMAFAGGSRISAVASAVVLRWPAWNQVAILTLFTAAALTRVIHLAQGRQLILVQLADPKPRQAEDRILGTVIGDGDAAS